MADDELDTLYQVQPDVFTAKRTELADAAKRRGDAASAKRIGAARRPTTAAWIVNRLALQNKDAKRRLADLGDRLRTAHSSMDGERIRELSAEQHTLINQLSRVALQLAGVGDPSAALRDDLNSTLQAAIADPEVTARLGRLAKGERWSGFGEFGDVTQVSTRTSRAKSERKAPEPAKKPQRDRKGASAEKQRQELQAMVTAAERDKAAADDVLSERTVERDALQQRRDEAQANLREIERELKAAENRHRKAERARQAATTSVREAKAELKRR